jgi:hypothetical protein
VRLLARLTSYLRHRLLGGESLIAMESTGEEVINEEELKALPPDERAKWDPRTSPRFSGGGSHGEDPASSPP